jgi:hypothetical protein
MRLRMLVVSLLVILTTAMRPQEWAYSCELASLANALDGIGIRIDEAFIRTKTPIDIRPRGTDLYGRAAWTDPNKVIVGNIRYYGLENGLSYGVFPRPMARAVARRDPMLRARGDGSLSRSNWHIR